MVVKAVAAGDGRLVSSCGKSGNAGKEHTDSRRFRNRPRLQNQSANRIKHHNPQQTEVKNSRRQQSSYSSRQSS